MLKSAFQIRAPPSLGRLCPTCTLLTCHPFVIYLLFSFLTTPRVSGRQQLGLRISLSLDLVQGQHSRHSNLEGGREGRDMCTRPPLTLSPTPNRLPAISFRRGVGGLWGQIHSFPSHSGLQGSPRTPVPQHFQRHLSRLQVKPFPLRSGKAPISTVVKLISLPNSCFHLKYQR